MDLLLRSSRFEEEEEEAQAPGASAGSEPRRARMAGPRFGQWVLSEIRPNMGARSPNRCEMSKGPRLTKRSIGQSQHTQQASLHTHLGERSRAQVETNPKLVDTGPTLAEPSPTSSEARPNAIECRPISAAEPVEKWAMLASTSQNLVDSNRKMEGTRPERCRN